VGKWVPISILLLFGATPLRKEGAAFEPPSLSIITTECRLMQTILREGETGVWFDIANNEHVPCGTSKQIYLENGSLHVTDSAHDVTITFALSRKKLVGVGLAMIFAACLGLGGIFFRNLLTIKASRQAWSPQLGPGPVDDRKNITVVECAAPTFEEAENIVRDYRYIRTRVANTPASTPAAVKSSEDYLPRRIPAMSRVGRTPHGWNNRSES
jgi:hypothetical protein